jgi:hypothetical protein
VPTDAQAHPSTAPIRPNCRSTPLSLRLASQWIRSQPYQPIPKPKHSSTSTFAYKLRTYSAPSTNIYGPYQHHLNYLPYLRRETHLRRKKSWRKKRANGFRTI